MAKREVVMVTCDRCGRDETQSKTEVTKEPEISLMWGGNATSLDDLCRACRRTVANNVEGILRPTKKTKKD